MNIKPKFMCEHCGCELEWDDEDGFKCHCFWEEDALDPDDFEFEEGMGTA